MSVDGVTPEDANALADAVIDAEFVPKKIPAMDDVDGQRRALVGALSTAFLLMSTTDTSIQVLPPIVGDLADRLFAQGVRQTEHVDLDTLKEIATAVPSWVVDGVRQESAKVPEQPSHTEGEAFVEMTATAPEPPKRMAKTARATPL